MIETGALLLFDGTCGFCARSVQFVLQREHRRRTLRFASLDSSIGREVRAQYPELDGVDSVIWIEAGSTEKDYRLYVRSEAVFRVLKYLGGVWTALAVAGDHPEVAAGLGVRLRRAPPSQDHSASGRVVFVAESRAAVAVY